MLRESVKILGVRVDAVGLEGAVERVGFMIEEGGPHQVVTPNPEQVMLAQKDPEFREILNQADLAIPDGVGLVWASRIISKLQSQNSKPQLKTQTWENQRPQTNPFVLVERVTGTDLMIRLCQEASHQGWSVFLLGAAPGVAAEAARRLVQRYPGLNLVGTSSVDPTSNLQLPTSNFQLPTSDLLFVAYGAPTQEKWIAQHLPQLPVKVAMGVGGAFEFVVGQQKRAPRLLRRWGLEWLWRLLTQPWRARRQLALIRFVALTLKQRLLS